MTPFEIRNYKKLSKKSLRAQFTLNIAPDNLGFVVHNCNYVVMPDKSFWSFPSKEYDSASGVKKYFTLMQIKNKTICEELEKEVLKQLQEIDKESYVSDQKEQSEVSAESSDLPF